MKRIKIFEEFVKNPSPKSGSTIWKKKSGVETEEEDDDDDKKIPGTWVDSKGVVHIKNWKTY